MADESVTIPRPLYDSLIEQATNLASTSIKMGVVLSEEYENAMRPLAENLQATIAQCPPATGAWDGTFDEALVIEEVFRHDSQPDRTGESVGVRLTYPPAGKTVESYSKPTRDANRRTAMTGLRRMVERHAADLRRASSI